MSFTKVAVPGQLNMLTEVLDDYCLEHGIPHGEERDNVAYRLLGLFNSGTTDTEELAAALRSSATVEKLPRKAQG